MMHTEIKDKPSIQYLLESPKGRCTERHIRVSFPEFYKYIESIYDKFDITFREKLYWYYHDIHTHPVCPVCGKPVKYMNFVDGYLQYCSYKCSFESEQRTDKIRKTKEEKYGDGAFNNRRKFVDTCNERHGGAGFGSKETNDRIRRTKKDRYGDENYSNRDKARSTMMERYGGIGMASDITNKKIRKTKKDRYGDANYNNRDKAYSTMMERYGVPNISMSHDNKQKCINSFRERYGVDWISQSNEVKQKARETTMERYGVESVFQLEENKKKAKMGRWKQVMDNNPDILNIDKEDGLIMYTCSCPHDPTKCRMKSVCDGTYKISSIHRNVRLYHNTELCTNILPIQYDRISNTTIEQFVKDILDEHSIDYITNDRTVLSGKELDIYIPSHRLAIECNGVYWHSLKDSKYHHDKWDACRNRGVQLLTIWEDQIVNKPEVVKNIILSRLSIYNERIGASKCKVQPVPTKESMVFLNRNHLQGPVNGSVRLGLYYKGQLVSLMVFGKKRKALGSSNEENTYELYRYCNACGVQVVHGAERLFKYFISDHPGCTVESFSSNDISSGSLYETLGFTRVGEQATSYWYVDKNLQRHHRYTFRKDVLVRNGADPNMTEFEITDSMGLYRIYDSGQQLWRF